MRPNLNCSYRNIRDWSYFNISIILLLRGCKPELIHELQFHVFPYLYVNSLRDAYFYKLTQLMVWKACSLFKALIEAGRGERKENQACRRKQVGLNWEPVTGWRGCGLNRVLFITYLEYQKTKQHWRKERWRSKELRVDFLHVQRTNKRSYLLQCRLHYTRDNLWKSLLTLRQFLFLSKNLHSNLKR